MAELEKHIFLTDSPTRWQRIKWASRIFILLFVLIFVVLILATGKYLFVPDIPHLKSENAQYISILNQGKKAINKAIDKKYEGFGKFINKKPAQLKQIKYVGKADSFHNMRSPVRAAFYDANDEQSYFSLKNNITKINMLIPRWMYIDSVADTVFVDSNFRGSEIIKGSGVKVVAMLSNFVGDDFNGFVLHRVLNNKEKRSRLINDVISIIQKNKFEGINIDFEELKEKTDEPLTDFMKELYSKMHNLNLLVTIDVPPFNPDFNLKELAKYSDYIFLMAYDQYSSTSEPGPICSQTWIESTVDYALKQVPNQKLVLAIAGYGYDWAKNMKANDVSYAEALSIANESESKVIFDTSTYNLSYNYSDESNIEHQVYFTDAVTNFNTIRFASEIDVAGVALWRLGSEDYRLWTFFNKDIDDAGVDSFDYNILKHVNQINDVDYIGEGEVLDVITTPKAGTISIITDTLEDLITNETYESLPTIFVIKKFGHKDKKIVLSFDDGPDATYTPAIIDILSKEHVPAVFFLIGINAENNIPIVKRLFNEGFEIGNHSFSHPNMALISKKRALLELNSTRLLIESITGHTTVMFRAPYNADSEPETMQELEPVALAKENSYLTIGESIDPNDWEEGVTADTIINRIKQQEKNGSIILLHDAGGNREATIKALPHIIKYFKDKGYTFISVSDLLNETKIDLMPEVPKTKSFYIIQLSYYIAEIGFWGSRTLFYLFVVCVILSIGRLLILAFFATKQFNKDKQIVLPPLTNNLFVSIIVPAYNEEVNAVKSVENLLKTTYSNYNIIFIDDGSKDSTYKIVSDAFYDNNKVSVFTKPNGGKASALNFGIAQTNAEFVLCVDADTNLSPYALELLIRHFNKSDVAAVAGNVKVGNEINILTYWQSIEYITSQNFDRNAFAYINAITVVPGAIGIFRKSALITAGGFTSDTFAEDCDLTMRLLRAGYSIKNENRAIAFTEVPETLNQFLKQRFRWSFGVMQSFWKNRDVLFNSTYGTLGWIALPNILLFQILIPIIAPLADLLMIIGFITGNAIIILKFYGLYMLIDLAVGILAFNFENEAYWKLLWLIPQRIVYRWIMLYILFKSIRRALKGQLQSWGVLKRTGNAMKA